MIPTALFLGPIIYEACSRYGDVTEGLFIGFFSSIWCLFLLIPLDETFPTEDDYDGLHMPIKEIRPIQTMSGDTTVFRMAEYHLYTVQKGQLSDKNQVYYRYRCNGEIVDVAVHKVNVVETTTISPCEERVYGVEYTGNMSTWSRLFWGDWDKWRHHMYDEPKITIYVPTKETILTNQ